MTPAQITLSMGPALLAAGISVLNSIGAHADKISRRDDASNAMHCDGTTRANWGLVKLEGDLRLTTDQEGLWATSA